MHVSEIRLPMLKRTIVGKSKNITLFSFMTFFLQKFNAELRTYKKKENVLRLCSFFSFRLNGHTLMSPL